MAILLTLLVALPVLLFWLRTPAGQIYNGFMAGNDDYYSYLAKMREGWSGAWTFVNRYTLEGNRPSFVFGFYLLLGHLARWLHLPLWAAYHLARFALLLLALQAVWAFLGTQTLAPWQRRWALLLTFGLSSFGVVVPPNSPLVMLEMHLADHLYLSAFYPHYLVDGIALCWGLVLYQRYLASPDWRRLALGSLCIWALALVHPYLVLTALAVPAVHTLLFRRDMLRRTFTWCLVLGLAALPVMGYMAYALYGDPGLAAWRAQAITVPYSVWLQLIWFGLGTPLAVYGAWRVWRRGAGQPAAVAVTWLAVDLLLVDSHIIANSSEFSIFMGTPAALLVAYGLEPLRERCRRPLSAALLQAVLILALGFSCLLITVSAIVAPFLPDAGLHSKFYLSPGYWAAMQYLDQHSTAATVTLSSFTAANQIPAYTDGRVYVGHLVETLDLRKKYQAARSFYEGSLSPEAAQSLLRSQGVVYVLEDRYNQYSMRPLDPAPWVPDLSRYTFLEPVFQTPDATVYRVG